MAQENKYYTPQIEEFYVGFEFEYNDVKYVADATRTDEGTIYLKGDYRVESEWVKETFSDKTFCYCGGEVDDEVHSNLECFIEIGSVRVKYLDKDDIISLGFRKQTIPNVFNDDEFVDGFTLIIDESNEILLYKNDLNIRIAKQTVYNKNTGNWTADLLFQGKIKNKSELKRQLGIIKST